MLARMPSKGPRPSSQSGVTDASSTRTESDTPFRSAFSRAASQAYGSISTARTSWAPRRAAEIARMPDPHPASRSDSPADRARSISLSTPRVVSCSAVPNAMPGSMVTTTAPIGASKGASTGASASHQLGVTTRRGVMVLGPSPCLHKTDQSRCSCQCQVRGTSSSPVAFRSTSCARFKNASGSSGGGTYVINRPSTSCTPLAPRPSSASTRSSDVMGEIRSTDRASQRSGEALVTPV